MKILLVSQYFWPEQFIINELVKCLASQGHIIEVLTGKPNYPEGAIFQRYSAHGTMKELFVDNVPVYRVPILPRGKKGVRKLLLNYLSFIFSGLFYFRRAVKGKKFDAILFFAPSPITSVIPAIFLKWRIKTHLAVWVQDLWPESLRATGFIENSFLLRLVGQIVKFIYSASDTLLVPSQAFKSSMARYVSQEKIVYYPNSFLDAPSCIDTVEQIPEKLLFELENNHCFVFAGNLGSAQSVETLVLAAEKLTYLPRCKLILVGSGRMSDWITQQIQVKNLNNLIFPGRIPGAAMPTIFSRAMGLIVTLRRDEIFSYTIPSKIQAYLAAGRPILAALEGEGARIIKEAGAGLISPAEDADALAKNIEKIYHMPDSEREELGQKGRDYFLEHFEMIKQSQRLIDILQNRLYSARS